MEEAVSPDLDTAAGVLAAARGETAAADGAERRRLQLAVAWAAMHSTDSLALAAVYPGTGTMWGDTAMPIAGPGAPLVTEFSIAEFASAIGLPTEVGRCYLGEAVELRYRLSRCWDRVLAGQLPAWRARRIARATIILSVEAAAHVDAHVAALAHKVRTCQLDRLVEEAIARFMPEEAERRRRRAADGRRFDVETHQSSLQGTASVSGELDLADALDLDAAVTAGAATLKDLGSTASLDVRRAAALGQLARHQPALDLDTQPEPAETTPARTPAQEPRRGRQVVLHVHLAQSAITPAASPVSTVGRVEGLGPVTAEQIRSWCATPDARVTVRPVIDLAEHIDVDAYEIPDRLAEQTKLTLPTCRFPWCTRPARPLRPGEHGTDCDHVHEHDRDGTTCSGNLAPLCRSHHRLKTHSAWSYEPLDRTTFLWTSPHRYQYLRDHTGTVDVTPDRYRTPPDRTPPDL